MLKKTTGTVLVFVLVIALAATFGVVAGTTTEITIAPESGCRLNDRGRLVCAWESAEGRIELSPLLDICDCGDPDSAACAADCDDEVTQCDDQGGVTECEVIRTRDGSVAVAIAQCGNGVTAIFAKTCGG